MNHTHQPAVGDIRTPVTGVLIAGGVILCRDRDCPDWNPVNGFAVLCDCGKADLCPEYGPILRGER